MGRYIERKKKLLRDFCIPEEEIDSIPWWKFKSEIAVDNYIKSFLAKHLQGSD